MNENIPFELFFNLSLRPFLFLFADNIIIRLREMHRIRKDTFVWLIYILSFLFVDTYMIL